MMWTTSIENYHCPLDWWMVERNKDPDTRTEPTDFVNVGSVKTEGGMQNIGYSEQGSDPDSKESGENSHAESEYFDPDPYDEASEANETEFFSLRRRGWI